MTQCQIDLVREATKCDYEQLDTNLLKREAVFTIDNETKVFIKKTGRRLQQKTFIHIVNIRHVMHGEEASNYSLDLFFCRGVTGIDYTENERNVFRLPRRFASNSSERCGSFKSIHGKISSPKHKSFNAYSEFISFSGNVEQKNKVRFESTPYKEKKTEEENKEKEVTDEYSEDSDNEYIQRNKKAKKTETNLETQKKMYVQRDINSIFTTKKKRKKWLQFKCFN
ncbi:unnamed protein product [Mytilus coruscus]|uniref:Uncharacterized protein n=1 Tax=Mytilus coruscus TaxID=42192 RepID=A0A6J8ES92_MYTCO|nr:unnamed protein product [Mytilus coruscus]